MIASALPPCLDLGPGVLEGHRPTEDRGTRRGVGVLDEVAEAFELHGLADRQLRQRGLDARPADDDLRIGIEVREQVLLREGTGRANRWRRRATRRQRVLSDSSGASPWGGVPSGEAPSAGDRRAAELGDAPSASLTTDVQCDEVGTQSHPRGLRQTRFGRGSSWRRRARSRARCLNGRMRVPASGSSGCWDLHVLECPPVVLEDHLERVEHRERRCLR